MEKLRRLVNQIAYTPPSQRLNTFSLLQLSLIPLLSFASSLYGLALSLRHHLYNFGLLRQQRLPVPVISVGNLTWGGNGKTPMVEFIALAFANSGISTLILTRGYGGADEAKMLQMHLQGTYAKIGVGANRVTTAACFLERYGYINTSTCFERLFSGQNENNHPDAEKIGISILDDGMQHLKLWRDLEIVMVNGMTPGGNHQLLPLGPLREPLTALSRADIIVVHHADLVSEQNIEVIESTIQNVKDSVPLFFSRMVPSHFFKAGNVSCKLPLRTVSSVIVLCVSAIGSPDSFVRRIEEMGALYVDRLDFCDHHLFLTEDMHTIKIRLEKLHAKFCSKPVVVVTEKDYFREAESFKRLDPFEVLVLCSHLQILPHKGYTGDSFMKLLKQLLLSKNSSIGVL